MRSTHGYAGVVRRVGAASLAVVASAMAGCAGGGDDPARGQPRPAATGSVTTTTSSPQPAQSSTTTAATTPPTAQIPEAARAHTEAGAEAFVKFYMEQANRAWTEPNASVLPPLSDAGCLSCKDIQATAEDLKTSGQRYVSRPVTVTRVAAFGGAPPPQQYVRLFMTQHKVDVVDSNGLVVLTDPNKALVRTAGVIWEGSSWRMYGIAE